MVARLRVEQQREIVETRWPGLRVRPMNLPPHGDLFAEQRFGVGILRAFLKQRGEVVHAPGRIGMSIRQQPSSLCERFAQAAVRPHRTGSVGEAGHPADPSLLPRRRGRRRAGHAAARAPCAATVRPAPARQGSRRRCPTPLEVPPESPAATRATSPPARRRDRATRVQ